MNSDGYKICLFLLLFTIKELILGPFYLNSEVFISGLDHIFCLYKYDHLCLIPNVLRVQIAKVDQVKFDVMELHARPELAAQQRMVDDASGDVKVRKKHRRIAKYTQTHRADSLLIPMKVLISVPFIFL